MDINNFFKKNIESINIFNILSLSLSLTYIIARIFLKNDNSKNSRFIIPTIILIFSLILLISKNNLENIKDEDKKNNIKDLVWINVFTYVFFTFILILILIFFIYDENSSFKTLLNKIPEKFRYMLIGLLIGIIITTFYVVNFNK